MKGRERRERTYMGTKLTRCVEMKRDWMEWRNKEGKTT